MTENEVLIEETVAKEMTLAAEKEERDRKWMKENVYSKFPKDFSFAKEFEKHKLREELASIRKWLFDNDWKCNKIVIGEWQETDERWQTYLAERTEKRARQDEILALLGGA
jgi:hypothetical protein